MLLSSQLVTAGIAAVVDKIMAETLCCDNIV